MTNTFCPHGQALWELRAFPPAIEPSDEYFNMLARIRYNHKKEATQFGILNTIVVRFLFRTPLPKEDDRGRPLEYWRYFTIQDNIANAIRLGFAKITEDSDSYDRLCAMSSPDVDGADVHFVYEYLRNNPSLYGNPFYQWEQVHRIWLAGGLQCPNCWAEKNRIEARIFRWLGDVSKAEEEDDWDAEE